LTFRGEDRKHWHSVAEVENTFEPQLLAKAEGAPSLLEQGE
jgi:hypothetical protein